MSRFLWIGDITFIPSRGMEEFSRESFFSASASNLCSGNKPVAKGQWLADYREN